ncbi:hypothetical protein DBV15_07262 [Temnothorax longispinosus]|uniref:Uncharacterized protein n=1 Tax=Temnothorax longispinosus TaxID=300112 RepID=A0A4V6RG51_9HYME|nr:hypothetical protein DBV15_07262 [Temnothorax longispinosus]
MFIVITPVFLAGAVSITVLSNIRPRIHSTRRRGRSRRYYTCPFAGVQQKDCSSTTTRTRARGSCELKNRTVINNRFLPAPHPPKARFFRRGLHEAGQGGDEVDGGENVGHKNVPVRNGPGEEREPDEFASLPATVPSGWRLGPVHVSWVYIALLSFIPCYCHTAATACIARIYPPECAHYLYMQPYRYRLYLSWRRCYLGMLLFPVNFLGMQRARGAVSLRLSLSSIIPRSIARHGDCFREGLLSATCLRTAKPIPKHGASRHRSSRNRATSEFQVRAYIAIGYHELPRALTGTRRGNLTLITL